MEKEKLRESTKLNELSKQQNDYINKINNLVKERDLKSTTLKIFEQMEKSVCKIVKSDSTGTGFIVLLPFPDKLHPLPVLITCYHVLKNEDVEDGKQIKLIFNENEEKIIQMNKKRLN